MSELFCHKCGIREDEDGSGHGFREHRGMLLCRGCLLETARYTSIVEADRDEARAELARWQDRTAGARLVEAERDRLRAILAKLMRRCPMADRITIPARECVSGIEDAGFPSCPWYVMESQPYCLHPLSGQRELPQIGSVPERPSWCPLGPGPDVWVRLGTEPLTGGPMQEPHV